MLDLLARLADIATARRPGVSDLKAALGIVEHVLGAAEAYVVRGGDPAFLRIGDDAPPHEYEIKQRGYWILWRELADGEGTAGLAFDVTARRVEVTGPLEPGVPCSHIVCGLPAEESNSELLVARGPWPRGLTPDQTSFILVARAMLAGLVAGLLDGDHRARQAQQLRALADVSKAFSEAADMEAALGSMATALAKASRFDWVMIALLDDSASRVLDLAINKARYSNTETYARAVGGHDLVLQAASALAATRQPLLFPDLHGSESLVPPENRSFVERAHIVSSAVFPILFQERMLGTVSFASFAKHDLVPPEVAFLGDLVSQAATAIKGLSLYRELEEARRIQHFLARTDPLTGVPNRRYIEEVMRTEVARSRRYDEPLSVVMADLDAFKDVNDSFGHHAGDQVLKHVAALARACSREADFVGRWGGDEFLFILPVTDAEGAAEFAERFRRAVGAAAVDAGGLMARVTVSAGVAEGDGKHHLSPDQLVDLADHALYRAKAAGGDRVMREQYKAAA